MRAQRFALAWGAAFLLAAASFLAAAAPGKVLRYASQFDPGTMDPHAIASLYNARVLTQIYEPLIWRDEQFRLEPRLALSWTPTGPTTWRFKLRPNVKFHDGTPFDAEDVIFTIQRAQAPTSAQRITLPNVVGVKKVDDLTIDIMTSQPTPVLPLAITNMRIMSKAWSVKHKVEKPLDFNAKEETYASRNANGTGPYQLKQWDADVKTVLIAFPGYWGKRGNVTEAQYLVIGTAATRVAGLISGEIDFVVDPAVQDVDRLLSMPGVKVVQGMSLGTQYLGFDFSRDTLLYSDVKGKNPFRDVRVRQAFRLAIDNAALQAKVMRTSGTAASVILSPIVDGYDARFDRKPSYDPARARALLKEAGYPDGFGVTLDCSAQQPADAICQAVAAMLARVGVRVTYQPLAFNIVLPKLLGRDTSFYCIGWTPITADAEGVLVPLVHSRTAPGTGDYNFGGYANPAVDALVDKARVELDTAKRKQYLVEATAALDADFALIPLIHRRVVWVMRKNVTAIARPNDNLDLRFVNIE
jgi:peptide/nickel transport system substrate-binding protein